MLLFSGSKLLQSNATPLATAATHKYTRVHTTGSADLYFCDLELIFMERARNNDVPNDKLLRRFHRRRNLSRIPLLRARLSRFEGPRPEAIFDIFQKKSFDRL